MRIISGIFRSRKLKSPASDIVRPTSDRAKETLFNMLSNEIDFDGIECMDLFCGSGSLGIECISRGASKCNFVDEDTRLVLSNIELLKISDKCSVFEVNALSFLENKGLFDPGKIELVLCDPPYNFDNYNRLISGVAPLKSLFVLEHSDKYRPDAKFKKYQYNFKKVGTVNFTFYNFT